MFSQVSIILFSRGSGVAETPLADPPRQTPLGRYSPRQTPPHQADASPPGMATAADGTHPTGMHSCLDIQVLLVHNN